MQKIVLDTSIFIDQIRTGKSLLHTLTKQAPENIILLIPTIVIYELHSGLSMQKESVCSEVSKMYLDQEKIDLDEEVAEKAGELRRNKIIEGNDAVIAATALLYGDYLATLNVRHFQKVPGLKLWPSK